MLHRRRSNLPGKQLPHRKVVEQDEGTLGSRNMQKDKCTNRGFKVKRRKSQPEGGQEVAAIQPEGHDNQSAGERRTEVDQSTAAGISTPQGDYHAVRACEPPKEWEPRTAPRAEGGGEARAPNMDRRGLMSCLATTGCWGHPNE
jgi:hypothetical protein